MCGLANKIYTRQTLPLIILYIQSLTLHKYLGLLLTWRFIPLNSFEDSKFIDCMKAYLQTKFDKTSSWDTWRSLNIFGYNKFRTMKIFFGITKFKKQNADPFP